MLALVFHYTCIFVTLFTNLLSLKNCQNISINKDLEKVTFTAIEKYVDLNKGIYMTFLVYFYQF